MEILNHRREIGQALWLWQLLNACVIAATAEEWWPVDNGKGHSDESLSVQLDIPSATARKWRMRLEKLGLIRTVKVGPRRRRFELLNLGFALNKKDTEPEARALVN